MMYKRWGSGWVVRGSGGEFTMGLKLWDVVFADGHGAVRNWKGFGVRVILRKQSLKALLCSYAVLNAWARVR